MRALIYEVPERVGIGWVDIAGRPLLVRQIQWLRDAGIEDVVVEVCVGPDDSARSGWLLGDDPLLSRVQVVPTPSPLGPDELSRRAGLLRSERALNLPADVIAGGALDLERNHAAHMILPLPEGLQAAIAAVSLRSRDDCDEEELHITEAWGARIADLSDALDMACVALTGHAPGIMLHALEHTPGIWVARGARIAPSARVEAPVYLGLDALILPGAHVGPRAVVLDRAVVERGASIVEGMVGADTLIGENTRVRHALATRHALVSFQDGTRTSIIDPLVLASRVRSTAFTSRVIAFFLGILLFPFWLLFALVARLRGRTAQRVLLARGGVAWRIGTLGVPVIDLVPALLDVVVGTRDLVGVAQEPVLEIAARRPYPSMAPRAGAIDITWHLAPSHSPQTALRLWRWYARCKTNDLDRSLLMQREPPA